MSMLYRTVVFTLVLLIVSLMWPGELLSETLIQSISFDLAPHGTSFQNYQQFNPSWGILQGVGLTLSGMANSDFFVFTNTLDTPVSFTGFTEIHFKSNFDLTLLAGAISENQSASGVFDNSLSFSKSSSNLNLFIGTGLLPPDLQFDNGHSSTAGSDDSRVFVSNAAHVGSVRGTEKITYIYLPAVPEPASWVLATIPLVCGFLYLFYWDCTLLLFFRKIRKKRDFPA
jgi:hypothetical protein